MDRKKMKDFRVKGAMVYDVYRYPNIFQYYQHRKYPYRYFATVQPKHGVRYKQEGTADNLNDFKKQIRGYLKELKKKGQIP